MGSLQPLNYSDKKCGTFPRNLLWAVYLKLQFFRLRYIWNKNTWILCKCTCTHNLWEVVFTPGEVVKWAYLHSIHIIIVWQRFCEPARLRIAYCPWVRVFRVFRVLSATSDWRGWNQCVANWFMFWQYDLFLAPACSGGGGAYLIFAYCQCILLLFLLLSWLLVMSGGKPAAVQ